jgi:hypothetical protein
MGKPLTLQQEEDSLYTLSVGSGSPSKGLTLYDCVEAISQDATPCL